MAVDLGQVLAAEQGAAIASMARMAIQQADFQAKVFTRLEASIDLVEASAAQFLGKAGENPRYQPQSSPPAV